MGNKKLITLSVVLLLLTGLIVFIFIIKGDEKQKYSDELTKLINTNMKKGKLASVSYSCSGNMRGNTYEIKIDIDKNTATSIISDSYNEPNNVNKVDIEKGKVNQLIDYVDKYNLSAWSNLEIDETIQVLDACTPSIELIYKTGSKDYNIVYYHINPYSKLPSEGKEILDTFINMIESCMNVNN